MFTHLILYKEMPYFKYANSEEEAIKEASKNPDVVVGVVASEGLIVNQLKTRVVLETYETEKIEQLVKVDEDTFQVVPEEIKAPLTEELQEILDQED